MDYLWLLNNILFVVLLFPDMPCITRGPQGFTKTKGVESLHPVSITRFPLTRFSPGSGLLRNPFVHRWRLKFSRVWVRKDGDLLTEIGCSQQPGTKSASGLAENQSSTARCVPRSGLHVIYNVRASEEMSRTFVCAVWKSNWKVISLPNRSAPPGLAPAPPCPALSRPGPPSRARPRLALPPGGMFGFWIRQIPGHPLHENGLQRQVSVDTLVSSQGGTAAVVPVINRLSTVRCVPPMGLHRISFVRASEETFRTAIFDALEGKRDGCLLGEQTRRRPVLPRPAQPRLAATPCAAPPRRARGMSGFWIRQVFSIY